MGVGMSKIVTVIKTTLGGAVFSALAVAAAWINPALGQRSEHLVLLLVAQSETSPPSTTPLSPSAGVPARSSSAIITKWQESLVTHLLRFKRYPAHAGAAEGVVSLAFSIDRKGNVVGSRIDRTSGSAGLDAEALAMIKRAAPFPAPPPQVADADLSFVLPIRFTASERR
jgi:TonB family protein